LGSALRVLSRMLVELSDDAPGRPPSSKYSVLVNVLASITRTPVTRRRFSS
jgi:hypothetical protein